MTDPLIDKEELLRIIAHEFNDLADPVGASDSVLGYLRSVFTSAGMWDIGLHHAYTTEQLHRRIFGEPRVER
jgi:hypothetical protein